MEKNILLLSVFIAGLSPFLLPHILPLIPVYQTSIYGPEIFNTEVRRRLPLFLHSVSFVIGFSIVFSIVGADARAVGLILNPISPLFRQINGSLLIVFGIIMLAPLKTAWLNIEKRLTPSPNPATQFITRSLRTTVDDTQRQFAL